jgi:hypothetical protein
MSERPFVFYCSISGPNKELYQINVLARDNSLEVKNRFSEKSGYPAEDLKILFGNHEMTDSETLNDLVPLGFTTESKLSVELRNPMKIIVQTKDGKKYPVLLTPKCQLESATHAVCRLINIPPGLGDISVGGCKCDQHQTLNEMDISEGSFVKFCVRPLGDVILKEDCLTPSIFEASISYIEGHPYVKLVRYMSKELFCEVKNIMDLKKEKKEIFCLLKRLLLTILFCNFRCKGPFFYVCSDRSFQDSGLVSVVEEERKMIVN